ncbi:hypothetical protein ACLKMH_19865 [Psychromonas sp. KJ10-10]|uniref:hypothetical protein n=1 Tax=Psychromonas sp. KJ10-10 TaxID=3391823 RepID=UPI0039B49D24
MKSPLFKLTIFYITFGYLVFSAPSYAEQEEQTLSIDSKEEFSDNEIHACLKNTDTLELIQKKMAGNESMLQYVENKLEGYDRTKKVILDRVLYFKEYCDKQKKHCNDADHHRGKYKEVLADEVQFRLEAVSYIQEAIDLKKEEEAFAKTFDNNCENEEYEKNQVIALCKM